MASMLKKSRFVHVFEDVGILWHSLLKKRLHIEPALISYLDARKHEPSELRKNFGKIFDVLISEGFLVEDGCDDAMLKDAKEATANKQIQGLYLILTTACNLDCSYCLYKAKSSQSLRQIRNMSAEVMHDGLSLFANETEKNNRADKGYWEQITLYGGEPLLNLDCLKATHSSIRKMKAEGRIWKETCLVINTNGTLVDEAFTELVAQNKAEIQISIDGFQKTHDERRRTKQGKGSFDMTFNALKLLHKTGANFVPMITLNNSNLEEHPAFVKFLCNNFQIKRYYTNLLMATTEENSEYPRKAAQAMFEASGAAKKFGACDENFDRTLESFSQSQIVKQSCGAGRKITVFPSGEIHTCQALEKSGLSFIGFTSFDPNSPNWREWKTRTRFIIDECLDCPILGSCGGGCAAGSYNANGNIKAIDPNYCKWIKSLFMRWLVQ